MSWCYGEYEEDSRLDCDYTASPILKGRDGGKRLRTSCNGPP